METAAIPGLYLIAFVDFNSSNSDRKGQQYPVEYYLESVEEYSLSERKIHMSEPEPGNGKVNTVYMCFVNQARENTQISRREFVYNERPHDCKCLLRFELTA